MKASYSFFATLLSIEFVIAASSQFAAAKTISPEEAYSKVLSSSISTVKKIKSANQYELKQTVSVDSMPCIYLFGNNANNMLALSADDRTAPILAIYDNDASEAPDAPSNYWIEYYAQEISRLNADDCFSADCCDENFPTLEMHDIAPLITTKWGYAAPFNDKCYHYYTKQKCVPGCTAIAVAQIMNYWQWPKEHAYGEFGGRYNGYPTNFENVSFDWENMIDIYSESATSIQKDAVSNLMYYTAVSLSSNFGVSSTSANTKAIPYALIHQFNYDPSISLINRNYVTPDIWKNTIYNELAEGRPVLYAGLDKSSEVGHMFICDGVKLIDGEEYFHFNMGWSGASDGYYLLSAVGGTPYNQHSDVWSNPYIFIGVKPNETAQLDNSIIGVRQMLTNNLIETDTKISVDHVILSSERPWCNPILEAFLGVDIVDGTGISYDSKILGKGIRGDWNRYSTNCEGCWWMISATYDKTDCFSCDVPGEYFLQFFYEIRDMEGNVITKAPLQTARMDAVESHPVFSKITDVIEIDSEDSSIGGTTYFSLAGASIKGTPSVPGIYIKVRDGIASKILIQ